LASGVSNVGSYAIDQGSLANSNYAISYNGALLTVTQRPLLISAGSFSRIYGDANPAFTYTSNGLINGDVLTGSLATLASATSNVGSYAINQGSVAASANYSVTYAPGSLAITPRALTISANPLSRVYGDANPDLGYTSMGLVNGDGLTGALSTAATVRSNTGLYVIEQGSLAASTNYVVTYNPGNLTITQRGLIISATPQNRLVGEANPLLTYDTNGLVNGDALTGALATEANMASVAGNYAITQGSLSASTNYAVSFGGADLTVLNCASGAGCTAVVDVVKQVAVGVQSVAPTESAEEAQEEQKEQAAAESSADPKVMISAVIDTSGVTMPTPIDEPVSGGGNSSLWLPGAPQ
jgi:hypothetical protein